MTDELLLQDVEVIDKPIPFKIFSGLLRAHRDPEAGTMRLRGIASSSVHDRHGDQMTRTALEDMVRAANDNMTIFLNHSYSVPEDVAGSVEKATLVQRGLDGDNNPIWDLDFDVKVNDANPRAVDAFSAIEKGTKLGLSIGAMIPEGGAVRDKKKGTYVFNHVDLLETSIVGIPANPRSWVQTMVKALKSTQTEHLQTALGTVVLSTTLEDYGETTVEDTIEIKEAEKPKKPDMDDAPPQPQEVPEDDESSDGSQEAPGSDPDTEPSGTKELSTDVALIAATTETLSAAVSARVDLERQLAEMTEERDAALRKADESAEFALEAIHAAGQIIEKLADMPVGRKAVIRRASDELSSLERFYGPDLIKIIRRDESD